MFQGPSRPSKASSTTRCQRCLKLGHYTYECKESATQRPYISRPSRSQQFSNPKLMPKLEQHVPEELTKKAGIADQILSEKKKERQLEEKPHSEHRNKSSRARSYSNSSNASSLKRRSRSSSLSRSRSRSPRPQHKTTKRGTAITKGAAQSGSKSTREHKADHSRREATSRSSSRNGTNQNRERTSPRSLTPPSPPPHQRNKPSRTRPRGQHERVAKSEHESYRGRSPPRAQKARSLSPYSRRVAMTKSMQDSG